MDKCLTTRNNCTARILNAPRKPSLLIVTDHHSVIEDCNGIIPVIAFCNSIRPLEYINIVIPCNVETNDLVAMMWAVTHQGSPIDSWRTANSGVNHVSVMRILMKKTSMNPMELRIINLRTI